ncbi:MAG: hypothetical protein WCR39_03035, partial [Bacteroidales bacterium]
MKRAIKNILPAIIALFLVSNPLWAEKYVGGKPADVDLKGYAAGCALGTTVTEISLNNVRTYIRMDGVLWTD